MPSKQRDVLHSFRAGTDTVVQALGHLNPQRKPRDATLHPMLHVPDHHRVSQLTADQDLKTGLKPWAEGATLGFPSAPFRKKCSRVIFNEVL